MANSPPLKDQQSLLPNVRKEISTGERNSENEGKVGGHSGVESREGDIERREDNLQGKEENRDVKKTWNGGRKGK